MDTLKSFSIYELYFLASAFDCKTLVGLPDLQNLPIEPNETWEIVRASLIEKHLLDSDGKLTKEGAIVISMLEEYATASALTIINNFFITPCKNKDYSIIISLNKDNEYFIIKVDFVMMLQFLTEKIPSYSLRVPDEVEKTFLKNEITLSDDLKEVFVLDSALFVQHYPITKLKQDKNIQYESWFFSIHDNKIFGLDVHKQISYWFSQYYFFERIYTWLNIPFKKKEGSQEYDSNSINSFQWHF